MTPHDRLRGLVTLWRRELSASEARAREERSNASLSDRVEQGVALRNLEVIDRDAAAGNRTKLWLACSDPRAFDVTQIGPGSPVRLWWDSPDSADAVRATVGQRRSDRLSVLVDGAVPDRLEEGRFQLDRDAPQTTFRRGDRALKSFLDAPSNSPRGRLREILFGATAVEPGRDIEWAPLDQQLNAAQLRAVERAMTAPDVALIHGPPGTGKTRTLVEVIRQAAASGQRVLAAAASNTAVDNLAERLVAAGVDVVRLGHPARVSESIEERTLDAILERSGEAALARRWVAEANAIRRKVRMRSGRGTLDYAAKRELLGDARRLMGDARHHLKRVRRARVAAASVVCATAAGSDSQVLADTRFDLVVLDEATQAADPIALVALGRGDRVVLAGDPCQLPPTVIDRQAERGGLGVTLFERLVSDSVMLEVQHRMHETIMHFPSHSKYEGRLIAAPAVAAHTLADLGVADDPLRTGPLVFVDTAGKGWAEKRSTSMRPSTSNPAQAERTAAEVRRLLSRGLAPEHLAVITPYGAQVRLLRTILDIPGLDIGSIDGFQGREKEAVVVDLVRSNDNTDIGFLKDTRRMNVALTRARRFLLVIGDSATLGGHAYYDRFLSVVDDHGHWLSAWEDEAPVLD